MSHLNIAEAVPLGYAMVARVAEDAGVRALAIKGPVSGRLNYRPCRQSVDVDVWVDPSKAQAVQRFLSNLGWVMLKNPTAMRVLPMHATTWAHDSWPCTLDIHTTFPGFLAEDQQVFEVLWSERDQIGLAATRIPCTGKFGSLSIAALDCWRNPTEKIHSLEALKATVGQWEPECQTMWDGFLVSLGADETLMDLRATVTSRAAPTQQGTEYARWVLSTYALETRSLGVVATLSRLPLKHWPTAIRDEVMHAETAVNAVALGRGSIDIPPRPIRLIRLVRGLMAWPTAYARYRKAVRGRLRPYRGNDK